MRPFKETPSRIFLECPPLLSPSKNNWMNFDANCDGAILLRNKEAHRQRAGILPHLSDCNFEIFRCNPFRRHETKPVRGLSIISVHRIRPDPERISTRIWFLRAGETCWRLFNIKGRWKSRKALLVAFFGHWQCCQTTDSLYSQSILRLKAKDSN